jgi:hypothetical protein
MEVSMKGNARLWRNSACQGASWAFAIVLASVVTAAAQTSIFSIQKTPSPNPQGNTLNAVAATSTSDAWAVGYQNDNNLNDSRTLIQHWNGSTWTTVASPNPGTTPACTNSNTGNVLTAVTAVSTNDVWAVGYAFTCTALLKPMALHWNGTSWRVVPTPALNTNDNAAFNSVVALAANNVYAVGYKPATNGAVQTLIEHWNGTAWSVVSSPNGNNTGNVLTSVSANSATDIWTVGTLTAPGVEGRTLALHFNGSTWSVVPTPNVVHGGSGLTQNALTSVVAAGPNDVTAVGFTLANLTELTMVQHWDGVSWKVVPSPNVSRTAGSFNTLRGVTAVNRSDLYAVGFFSNSTTNGQQLRLILHFNGTAWTVISSPGKAMAQQLNGVFARFGAGDVWVAGAASVPGTDPESGFLQIPSTFLLFTSGG